MNNNPSIILKTADENSAIVSVLSRVIRGGNNVVPGGIVIVDIPPEQEICRDCGTTTDGCNGCHLFPAGSGEKRKKKRYIGVSLRSSGNRAAEIMVPGKMWKWLGTFGTVVEAARAYDRLAFVIEGRRARPIFWWRSTCKIRINNTDQNKSNNNTGCSDKT